MRRSSGRPGVRGKGTCTSSSWAAGEWEPLSRRALEQQGHIGRGDRPGPDGLPSAGLRLRRAPGHRRRLRPGHPARGGHRGGRRVRRGQQRRQLQHHRGPGGPRDVRRRERGGPDLRPPPRRGLPAARHPDGRHGAAGPPTRCCAGCCQPAPSRCGATRAVACSWPRCTPRRPGSATRSASCRRRPASGWRSSPGWAKAVLPTSQTVLQEGDLVHVMMRTDEVDKGRGGVRPGSRRRAVTDAGRDCRSRRGRPIHRRRAPGERPRGAPHRQGAHRHLGRAGAAARSGCSPTPARSPRSTRRRCSAATWSIAATGDDKVNLVVSLLAKTEYGVPRVVARVNNPKNEWLFNESWGVDVAVSTPRLMSALVEEAVSVGDLVRLLRFSQGDANLVELTLPPESALAGTQVGDVAWPQDTSLVTIIRGTPGADAEPGGDPGGGRRAALRGRAGPRGAVGGPAARYAARADRADHAPRARNRCGSGPLARVGKSPGTGVVRRRLRPGRRRPCGPFRPLPRPPSRRRRRSAPAPWRGRPR